MKIYRDNVKMYDDRLLKLSKLLNRSSFLRTFVFLISSAILIYLFSFNLFTPILFVFPLSILCFGAVVSHYNKINFRRSHTSFLKDINRYEILREKRILEELDTGYQFIDQNHPYTSDLDIFGQHSIFQLVSRTTTESGMILLSEWLSEPAPNPEIHDRQRSIKELAKKLDWRQDFQASGMHFQSGKNDYLKLLDWVEKPVTLLRYRRIYLAFAIILPIVLLISFYLLLNDFVLPNGYIYLSLMLLVLLIHYMVLRKVKPLVEDIVESSADNLNTFRGYRTLINKIEGEYFESKKLLELQSILIKNSNSAYHEIDRICKLLSFSQQRPIKKTPIGGNYFYSLFNSFLLLDLYLIIGAEKWKSKNKAVLKPWAEVVSEFEVISSFAGFYYSNPSYTFPEITEKDNHVHFDLLGHPLIHSNKRVSNNFHSEGHGNIVMITGSNMGGKSTFLRTVGVNLVLALAGAPCCTKYGQVTNLNIYTSMRTQDNLMKGASSFYAELGRIQRMLELIESNQNIYFLLDEMFKGTNSKDRHKGGFSLISQLNKLKTSGIIATHDIELAKLSENKKLVTNYSFNSEIKDNSMTFSYELHPDICTDFNASELMKKSGIKILSNIPDERNE